MKFDDSDNIGIKIPEKIKRLTDGKDCVTDSIGMSDSAVYIYDRYVLKIEKENKKTLSDIEMMKWLYGKIPVPKIICHEIKDGKSFLLTSKAEGEMSCAEYYLERPELLSELLAEGLKMLWAVDITDCPRSRGLDEELKEARYNVENGLVDTENTEPDTFGKNGFKDPAALLKWLEENRPAAEDIVLSHGDFCLPNIFLKENKVSCFIDMGDAGKADRWRDISLCLRSLGHNTDGTYGGRIYEGHSEQLFFKKLGITPDYEKLKYYLLLDELF